MLRNRFVHLAVIAAISLAIDPLTVSSQELITQKVLSADLALAIAQGALQSCRAQGYHISITVLDSSNVMKAFIRDDGTNIGTVELSRRKAYTALNYQKTSAEQLAIWKATPPPVNVPAAAAPSAGGVPIKVGKVTIGAVGASGAPGGDKDEACASAGIAKISDKLK
jgi:uncharacterized protein GlcG (DUF336 family)